MNEIIIFFAKYLFVFVVLGLGVVWLKAKRSLKSELIIAAVVSGVIALIVSRIAGKLYYDPRPFVSQHVTPLIGHVADNGFPSDHALLTGTLTAIAYFYNRKAFAAMGVLTVLVGISRVLAKVHSPIDIAGGWLIGILGAFAGYYLARWITRNYLHSSHSSTTPGETT